MLQLCGLDFLSKGMVFLDGRLIGRCQKHSQMLPMRCLAFSGIMHFHINVPAVWIETSHSLLHPGSYMMSEACVGQAGLLQWRVMVFGATRIVLHGHIHQTWCALVRWALSYWFWVLLSLFLCLSHILRGMYYPGLIWTGAVSQAVKPLSKSPLLGMPSVHSASLLLRQVQQRLLPPVGARPSGNLFKLTNFCIHDYRIGNKSMYCRLWCLHNSFPKALFSWVTGQNLRKQDVVWMN